MAFEEISDWEALRLKNIAEIRHCMEEHGIFVKEEFINREKKKKTPVSRKRKLSVDSPRPSRRSARLSGLSIPNFAEYVEDDIPIKKVEKVNRKKCPPSFGPIPDIEVGHVWDLRIDCSRDGVHRPTVAGIHPGPEGAYSVVLSGGYDDDMDSGVSFTYTGSGGRDLRGTKANPKNLRTAPQSKDQELNAANASLIKSVENKLPVRVVRGYKLNTVYAPAEGYRYDGLYYVSKWWLSIGKSGFKTYKYLFTRVEGQSPPPW